MVREASFNVWFSGVNREFYQRPWSFVTYGKGALQVEYIIIIIIIIIIERILKLSITCLPLKYRLKHLICSCQPPCYRFLSYWLTKEKCNGLTGVWVRSLTGGSSILILDERSAGLSCRKLQCSWMLLPASTWCSLPSLMAATGAHTSRST